MKSMTKQCYFESRVRLSADPLTTVSRLASAGLHEDYVVYEGEDQWSFASGVLAEITLDRSGAELRGPEEIQLPWDGAPLRQVQTLLDRVPVEEWRAYGWAAFELAYAKDGDIGSVGGQRLLHLVVPHTEVRLKGDWASLRSADRETLAAAVAVLSDEPAKQSPEPRPFDVRRSGAEEYQRAVQGAVSEINAHKFQKVILSRVVSLEHEVDFVRTYVSGRRGNSPARSFLLRLGGTEATGFSPEIVVRVGADGRVVSQPLAGTRALTHDAGRNERLRTELLADSKEVYEHAISVKIACDDLDSVCEPDSITVEEFMAVRERGSVQHLASRVAGQLAEGKSAWDAFAAAFPAVTASGVPKTAAYASIRAHEGRARGLYSGAVLTVDRDGAMDAALVLRAVYRQGGMTWMQAGAGIVGQSLPAREFEETCEKLDSVARFLVPTDVA
ncbi:salicylate synthase [Streptomyces sp. NBC_00035]|uniref:salicylate synthase n=1 Tax=Streptomyces sp. NBC_00035 TaxID=2903614 RepID=UPI003248D7C1